MKEKISVEKDRKGVRQRQLFVCADLKLCACISVGVIIVLASIPAIEMYTFVCSECKVLGVFFLIQSCVLSQTQSATFPTFLFILCFNACTSSLYVPCFTLNHTRAALRLCCESALYFLPLLGLGCNSGVSLLHLHTFHTDQ